MNIETDTETKIGKLQAASWMLKRAAERCEQIFNGLDCEYGDVLVLLNEANKVVIKLASEYKDLPWTISHSINAITDDNFLASAILARRAATDIGRFIREMDIPDC